MRVPGSNLLNMAMRALGQQTVQYKAFTKRVTNSAGLDVPEFAPARCLSGSVQPVPRQLYEQMKLDFQKNYVNFYVSKAVLDIRRDVAGDRIIFNGKTFQCESLTDWYAMDGWVAVLCVEIPAGTT